MTDVFDRVTRVRIMKAVRTRATEPEVCLCAALREIGLRFNTNDAKVLGKPDVCFRRNKLAVFVDGDFWHGRTWFEGAVAPATNAPFWISKFERNRLRDRQVNARLRRNGWSVLRLWGSEVRKAPEEAARKVRARLRRLIREGRSARNGHRAKA